MCESFAVEVCRRGEVTFLLVNGELDIATTPALEEHLLEAEQRSSDPLVVDLRRLTFLDSTGLAALFRAHERARDGGWRFAVINGTGQAHRLFQITDADRTIEVLEDPDEASAKGETCDRPRRRGWLAPSQPS